MQAVGEDFWLLDNAPPSLMEFLQDMILLARVKVNQLCKVPRWTGRAQPSYQEVICKVIRITRGQREKQES